MSVRSADGFHPAKTKCDGCGGNVSMILRIPGSSSSAEADVNMLSTMYRCAGGYLVITAAYQLANVVSIYGRLTVARSITGQVPRAASAFVACSSDSAKTGEATVMAGPVDPVSGAPCEVRICSSTRSSISLLIERPQLHTSSATSIGYMYKQVPNTAGRRCSRSVNDVTTPKKPGPEPRAAQYRSGRFSGSQYSFSPPAVTTSSPSTPSHAAPQTLLFQPYPPCSR